MKTKPSDKRNPKTPPITIDPYRKEHKCMPKNTPPNKGATENEPRRPPIHPLHTGT